MPLTSSTDPDSLETHSLTHTDAQRICRTSLEALRNLGSFMVQNVNRPEEMLRLLAEHERQVKLLRSALSRTA